MNKDDRVVTAVEINSFLRNKRPAWSEVGTENRSQASYLYWGFCAEARQRRAKRLGLANLNNFRGAFGRAAVSSCLTLALERLRWRNVASHWHRPQRGKRVLDWLVCISKACSWLISSVSKNDQLREEQAFHRQ